MIAELTNEYIPNIAEAQVSAWQAAFKGILSDELLSDLIVEDFADNWRKIITQKERKNWIWVNEEDKAVGFVSFGKPKDEKESADFEIMEYMFIPNFGERKLAIN